jgi:hypothetical protein
LSPRLFLELPRHLREGDLDSEEEDGADVRTHPSPIRAIRELFQAGVGPSAEE